MNCDYDFENIKWYNNDRNSNKAQEILKATYAGNNNVGYFNDLIVIVDEDIYYNYTYSSYGKLVKNKNSYNSNYRLIKTESTKYLKEFITKFNICYKENDREIKKNEKVKIYYFSLLEENIIEEFKNGKYGCILRIITNERGFGTSAHEISLYYDFTCNKIIEFGSNTGKDLDYLFNLFDKEFKELTTMVQSKTGKKFDKYNQFDLCPRELVNDKKEEAVITTKPQYKADSTLPLTYNKGLCAIWSIYTNQEFIKTRTEYCNEDYIEFKNQIALEDKDNIKNIDKVNDFKNNNDNKKIYDDFHTKCYKDFFNKRFKEYDEWIVKKKLSSNNSISHYTIGNYKFSKVYNKNNLYYFIYKKDNNIDLNNYISKKNIKEIKLDNGYSIIIEFEFKNPDNKITIFKKNNNLFYFINLKNEIIDIYKFRSFYNQVLNLKDGIYYEKYNESITIDKCRFKLYGNKIKNIHDLIGEIKEGNTITNYKGNNLYLFLDKVEKKYKDYYSYNKTKEFLDKNYDYKKIKYEKDKFKKKMIEELKIDYRFDRAFYFYKTIDDFIGGLRSNNIKGDPKKKNLNLGEIFDNPMNKLLYLQMKMITTEQNKQYIGNFKNHQFGHIFLKKGTTHQIEEKKKDIYLKYLDVERNYIRSGIDNCLDDKDKLLDMRY